MNAPGSLPHYSRPHTRNRSSTVSSLASIQQSSQPPPPPTPLQYGQSKTLNLWVSDLVPQPSNASANSNALGIMDVVLNHDSWPGVAAGDVIYVRAGSSNSSKSSGSTKTNTNMASKLDVNTLLKEDMNGFLFVVGQDDGQKQGGAQIKVPKALATVFGLQNRNDVILTKIPKESITADYVEIYFRDQYLGRCDMWRLGISLENRCLYADQKVTFIGSVNATIKTIYVNGRRLPSAYITSKTKMIYRSMSAKMTIFIQVCRELWQFADDGERYYEKICHFFLPSLTEKWKSTGTTHVVTIVLISRVYYEESELEYAAGPLRQDDEGQWYKDFFKVIVDLEVVHDWKPSFVTLKESFWSFQRDILLTHHYHQHTCKTKSPPSSFGSRSGSTLDWTEHHSSTESSGTAQVDEDEPPVRLVGRISYAHEGPILEALNLSLNPTETHYVDRSLFLTGSSTILITPGTGHFRVSKKLLRLTTSRLLDQGFGLDLVCLTKAPLHRSPIFSFRGAEPEMRDGGGWAAKDMDPLWAEDEDDIMAHPFGAPPSTMGMKRKASKEKSIYFWEPFWICVSFWDQQNNMPFREDRFVPRARMHEIQMLGLLEHDISSNLTIPYLRDNEGVKAPDAEHGQDMLDVLRDARDQFDSNVFATKDRPMLPRLSILGPTLTHPPLTTTNSSTTIKEKRPTSPIRTNSNQRRHVPSSQRTPHRPEYSTTSSTSSVATTVVSATSSRPSNKRSAPSASAVIEEVIRKPETLEPKRSSSPSQLSIRSSTSNTSTSTFRRKASRAATLGSKLAIGSVGVGQWLFNPFRATPSQPEASQVSISRVDVGRTASTSVPSSPSPPPAPSPIRKAFPKPIEIKTSVASRRPVGPRIDEDKMSGTDSAVSTISKQGGLPRSYVSPISSPSRDESGIPTLRRTTTGSTHITSPSVNPSTVSSAFTNSQSSLARRWQHNFAQPTFQYDIKWKSMCSPACLPLTTEYFPTKTELDTNYQVYSYDVLVGPETRSSFLLRKVPGMSDEDWPLLVMRQMAALRLAQGFQFIVAPSDSTGSEEPVSNLSGTISGSGGRTTQQNSGARFAASAHPRGASDFLKSITDHAYLSMSNQIHRISFDSLDQVIRLKRYVKKTTHSTDPFKYECLVWPRLGDGYTQVSTSFSYPNLEVFGWNRLDMLIVGYENNLTETLRYWRTRYVVIPSETPPPPHFAKSGERLSDEEVRLLGTDKLAELFAKARWQKPGETEVPPAPRFLPTWLEPSTCVLDENLMAQVDEIHETGPLRKKTRSDRLIQDMGLSLVAKAMREDDGVPIKDRVWHRRLYPDTFTGYEFVSWLVREFKDVSTREQGAEWGSKLQEQGLFEHCKGNHGFLDGHYFYRLKGEYALVKPTRAKWFRSASTIAPRPGTEDIMLSSSANLEAVASRAKLTLTPSATPQKAISSPKRTRRRLVLSQTIIIDVDQARRSNQAETVILHHDIIQNPQTAFHFEMNWVGTTARCIDELVKSWIRTIDKYGLRLVEAYVDPIASITDKNVFQSTFPIRLAIPPPSIPNLQKRLPEGTQASHYFEHTILRQFGYILDIEAGNRFSDQVDIFYSYRRASFKYSQFVHKSGLAFVQVIGGQEGFRWLTNRLAGASNSYTGYTAWGGGGSGAGPPVKQNSGTSMAPPGQGVLDSERTERVATSELIRRQLEGLRDFCADPERLQEFYEQTLAKLPAAVDESAIDETVMF